MTLPLIAIVGATGTGKSDLSLDVAERLAAHGHSAEIVNADAMQLYRGMDIGTAKVPHHDRRGIPHHLLDVLDVTDESSVADYQSLALAALDDIRSRGATPIIVGGSGLYMSSVLYDFRFPGTDPDIRARLESELAQVGPGMLHARLQERDPDAAQAIGPHNGRRIVRALEVIELTGTPFGSGLPDDSRLRGPTVIAGVSAPREELVELLARRVDRMWRAGLLDEVGELLSRGLERGVTARRAIGYAQAIAQRAGEITQVQAIERATALTRRFARRQVSWFRRYRNAEWFGFREEDLADQVLALTWNHA